MKVQLRPKKKKTQVETLLAFTESDFVFLGILHFTNNAPIVRFSERLMSI